MATAIIKTAEDQITCTICLEIFAEPKALPCLHTFCKTCLDKYIIEKYSQNRRGKGYKCPICRRLVSVPPHLKYEPEVWASELENNHSVASMIDAYKTTRGKTTETCSEHPEKELNLFCVDHKQFICSLCSPQHRRCSDVISREEARGDDISTENSIQTKSSKMKNLEEGMNLLFEQCNTIENLMDKQRTALGFLDQSERQFRAEVISMRQRLNKMTEKNKEISQDLSTKGTETDQANNQHQDQFQEQEIKLPYQGKPSWITGIAVLPSGKLLIVDHTNEAVFAFSLSLEFLCKTIIHPAPYDIAAITALQDHMMVSIPNTRELLKCHVLENGFVESGPKLKTNIECKAVASDEGNVAVCSNDELQIFETDGKVWMMVLDESYTETKFTYITMRASEQKVFITDHSYLEPHIKCLDFDGIIIWKVADGRITFCTGICVIGTQVMMTSWDSGKLLTVSFNGDRFETYRSNTVMFPWKLHVSSIENIICVSQYKTTISEEDKRTIKVLKIA
ncbi:E3 ubiquitin-protein ligase TRIM4-like [Pecten maximus]|uniref:E3 ubiquitin-protein ligase TRIM4-like n=1 Tax=Pecten maximus TaxID=6579 RepID=UPI001458E157|nr:E3 ubiquitin-protein ligase TRIM4-like [Pecten maximus]